MTLHVSTATSTSMIRLTVTRKTFEDRRTHRLQQQIPAGFEPPLISGYKLTHHAALRMVVRRIEIDWVREALTAPGRPSPVYGTLKYWGDYAMAVVDHDTRTIVTVGFGLQNGGVT